MSDSLSKAAKKNQKKRENRKKKNRDGAQESVNKPIEENIPLKDPLTVLKEKLAEAKSSGDHKLASKYRQDIWVLQDVSAGLKPELDEESLTSSLGRISSEKKIHEVQEVQENEKTTSSFDKELRKINKKLLQIERLKEMKANGEKLEASQESKIEKEESLREEARELEKMISEIAVTR